MDFSLSEEQSMLADSVARFIDNDYSFDTRQKFAESPKGYSEELWQTCAELGWTAVPFDEDDGGLGGGPVEMMLIMEQFGRGLLVEPFLANIVLAGGVLRRTANAGQKERWLAGIIDGSTQAALAFAEPQARYNLLNISTTASASDSGYILNGRKAFVLNGGGADILVVPARTRGTQTDADGISLFVVETTANGVTRKPYQTVDARQAAEISLDNVVVSDQNLLGTLHDGSNTLTAVVDEATLAVCAEAVGIIRTMHDKTVEYSKNRVQFGVPIGSFQALQHRMVDTLIACEQSKSLLLWSVMLSAAEASEAQKSISALKYQIGTAGVHVAKEAVQLHGGMGVTWEMDISHYFKRLTAISLLFGDADYHLDRYISLTG